MEPGAAAYLIVLFILVTLSAFFSSAETSLVSVNRMRLRTLVESGNKRAIILEKIITDSGKMLSAILIGNNIVNIAASSVATLMAQKIWGNYAVSIVAFVLTLAVLLFGEITPKTIATIHAEKVALLYAPIIYAFMFLLTPVIFVVNKMSLAVLFLLRIDPAKKQSTITETELRTIVDVSHEEGVIEKEEQQMIKNVFDFGDASAKDVMVPRIDMAMLDVNSTYDEVIELFRKEKFTRMPVYQDSSDNVIGIMNMKDLLLLDQNREFHVEDYLRKAYFTYEYKNLSELMLEMRKDSVNTIIVLDEYGATAGLITLEDLLEEIVGEIRDEYDYDESDEYQKLSETEYLLEGQMKLDDMNELLGTHLKSEDYDSIGGFLIEQLDKIPQQGEFLEYENLRLEVQKVEKNRIDTVYAKKL